MTRFSVDPARSEVRVHASSSVHGIEASSQALSGWIDAAIVDGALDLTSPPAAEVRLPLATLRSGNPLYDRETDRRLDVARHPDAVLSLGSAVAAAGGGRVAVAGTLAWHGVAREVDGEVTVRVDDEGDLVVDGEQSFDVRHWGVDPPRLALLKVHPDIRVLLHVVARPAGPAGG